MIQDVAGLGVGGDGSHARGRLLVLEDLEERHRPARGPGQGGPGLDPEDPERCARQALNKVEEELAAASVQAWARAMEARERAATEPAWPEMPEGMEPAETIVEPPTKEGRDPEPAANGRRWR